MALILLRCAFVLVVAGLAASFVMRPDSPLNAPEWPAWFVFGGLMGVAMGVIGLDVLFPRKRIDIVSTVYFGLIVGLFLTYVAGVALAPLLSESDYFVQIQLVLTMVLCYTCISVLMQTKDDFRFIIPYVEFAKEVKGLKPLVLDTSVIIDGRIADVVETGALDNQLVMPRFVLAELQGIADSSDKLRRGRGRRGLDVLNRLQNNPKIDLRIHDHELPEMAGQPVDMKLVLLAKQMEGKLVTGDYNLNKVAQLHNVPVINLNDVANSLKPVILPGEQMQVKIVKAGEEEGQGVGYLDDGTMIVVQGARHLLNQTVAVTVTSMLQTSAGRMIFGRV